MKKNFAARIEELRGMRSQRDFAAFLGIPLNTYTNYTRGVRKPKPVVVAGIASKLGVNPEYLTGASDEREPMRDPVRNPDYAMPGDAPKPARLKVVGMAAAMSISPVIGFEELLAGTDMEIPWVLDHAENCFAIRISGDSMEPDLRDGDVVAVRDVLPRTGDLCVCMLKGDGLVCKRWYWRNGVVKLDSTNPEGRSFEWTREQLVADQPIVWRLRVEGMWRRL